MIAFVFSGRPRPRVVWYLENEIIDETYEQRQGVEELTVNHLVLPNVQRDYQNMRVLCQASNILSEPPATKVVILDLNREFLERSIVRTVVLFPWADSRHVFCSSETINRPNSDQGKGSLGGQNLRGRVQNFRVQTSGSHNMVEGK